MPIKKKKKITKIMTVEVPKAEAPTAADSIKLALDSLEASTGWAIIRKIMDENIKYLETAILTKIDPMSKETLSDAEVENCRYKRELNIELRDTPTNYRKKLEETDDEPREFDPYYKTKADFDKPNSSSTI